MSFVLNQDFHDGYGNENSSAYNILANNVKNEVRCKLVSAQLFGKTPIRANLRLVSISLIGVLNL